MKLFHKSLLAFFICTGNYVYGQTAASAYTVTIHGSSNLHSWVENVELVTASASISRSNKTSIDVSSLSVIMGVYSIKSTEGSTMNNNTYKALKASEYPEIKYTLATAANSIIINAGCYVLKSKGKLTIAGVTKDVDMNVKIHEESGKLIFEGSQTIKMTDYNVKPPVAMLGMLKTGNEITINYRLVF